MKLSAIDLGFLYTKAIVNNKRIITKSVVGDGKSLEFKDLDMTTEDTKRQKDSISFKDGMLDYFVSDLAIDQSDTIYHSLKDDRFDSDSIKILVRTMFGLGFGYGQHQSYIVSGLPASHYGKFKDQIKALFMGQGQLVHNFSVDWDRFMSDEGMVIEARPQSAIGQVRTIEGRFLPQPHGAAMSRILAPDGSIEDKSLAAKTVAVIDPGFGTSDVYVLSALSPVERLTFSVPVAMNTAYTLISNKIKEKFGVTLPLYKIESIVRTNTFIKNGVAHDMTQVNVWAFKSTAHQLVAEIYNHWKNTHEIDHILTAGGGGAALYPYIQGEFRNIELLRNSQWSIVEGYNRWGKRTWKDAGVNA
ncbi:hypothetical protein D1872_51920 [compost metagenome]